MRKGRHPDAVHPRPRRSSNHEAIQGWAEGARAHARFWGGTRMGTGAAHAVRARSSAPCRTAHCPPGFRDALAEPLIAKELGAVADAELFCLARVRACACACAMRVLKEVHWAQERAWQGANTQHLEVPKRSRPVDYQQARPARREGREGGRNLLRCAPKEGGLYVRVGVCLVCVCVCGLVSG